ncbi:hypothetical protein [Cerasicoccus maritimus]|uniref:hypothetical protein n=1 Tax=Cerasicoccus maritimus TaxID=490089 RepID=UPI0028528EA2|nr:hypothetical protein [Cerasicoccus maritimus]
METEPVVSPQMWTALAIMLLLLLGGAVVSIMYSFKLHGRIVHQFRLLGEKFGIELEIPKATMGGLYRRNPTLYGRCRGHEMSIYPHGYGLDNTRQTDVAVRITTRASAKLHLTLAKRNLSGKLGQVGRLKEIKTGDVKFDEVFSLKSNDPEAALAIFNEEWRGKVMAEWPAEDSFLSLDKSILTHLKSGLPYEDKARLELEAMAEFCLDFSDNI